MLQKNLMLQLFVTKISMLTQWFMLDGAKPHTARVVLDFLHETSGDMLMSRHFPWHNKCRHIWPPHSLYIYIYIYKSFQLFPAGLLEEEAVYEEIHYIS
jgi:hypothetical protein